VGGEGAATQTFAPGGKYPRAATADALCLIQLRSIKKLIVLFSGRGHWTWSDGGDSGRSLSYRQPTMESGGASEAPPAGSGRSSSRKQYLDVLYTILCDFRRVLVHFGSCQV